MKIKCKKCNTEGDFDALSFFMQLLDSHTQKNELVEQMIKYLDENKYEDSKNEICLVIKQFLVDN